MIADGALLSLSLLTDPEHLYRNMADFSHATVTIRERGGPALPVSGVHADNDLYGLPNDLYFSAGALKRDIVYDVTVEGIAIPGAPAGAATRVDYWFRLIP